MLWEQWGCGFGLGRCSLDLGLDPCDLSWVAGQLADKSSQTLVVGSASDCEVGFNPFPSLSPHPTLSQLTCASRCWS